MTTLQYDTVFIWIQKIAISSIVFSDRGNLARKLETLEEFFFLMENWNDHYDIKPKTSKKVIDFLLANKTVMVHFDKMQLKRQKKTI